MSFSEEEDCISEYDLIFRNAKQVIVSTIGRVVVV